MELLDPVQQAAPHGDTLSAHYEVRRLLGEGGFGHVYEAWDAKLCRSVALKRLKQQADMLHPEKLLNEARLAASLRHAAFVRIFSVDGDGKSQSIVMELVEGQTLGQVMQAATMPLDTALDIACQIADAMDEAHAMDLVHGDLKPSNLMLEANGKVRILDFGLARQLDPQATQTTALCDLQGTIAYMAPERLTGRLPDMRGDIYALGAMLYEMLAGQRPFAHLNGLALAAAHMQSNAVWPAMPASVPPAIAALVRSMTAHDPLERPRTMRDVREAIAAQRSASGTSPLPSAQTKLPPETPSSVAIRLPIPRKRTLQICASVVLVAVVTAWQWPNVAPEVKALFTGEKAPAPYSEMASMKAGTEALRAFDRDSNQELAMKHFSTILKHNPEHAGANAGLSLVFTSRYLGTNRDETWLQRADIAAKQALASDDQLALAHVAQAWVLEHHGKRAEALQEITIALNLNPNIPIGMYGKARLLIHAQKFDLARDVLDKAIALYPNDTPFVSMLGRMHYNLGNYTEAEKHFRKVIQMAPQVTAAYADMSATLERLDRGDEALQVLQQGLQMHPDWELYTNLGTALFNRGNYLGAVQAFKNAVSENKGNPGNYLLWANLADAQRWVPGQIELSSGSYRRAITLIKVMLQHSPNDSKINSRLALYSAYAGLRDDAMKHVAQAVLLAPTLPDIHFRAALTYELLGKRNEAMVALKQALERGYPINLIESAPDLLTLRRDARYQQLLIDIERNQKK
ncbi:serine/threonine-protein kinase [Janthinobacterium psychrotolerans]|uniref:Serine/threonine protein kinase n=1 Tax=Janthinobacterium psychrotolerans TaxID=1747903 RepID=A0A1A7BSV5_9BURK|nr:serine/threonine-protein kinase [Janthinobacterium psychrotolerans]OBV36602.1 serine/threonine protein kinase [Janthinobacterium psychrotolerans]